MSRALLLVLMLLGGVGVAIQPSINGRLAQRVGTLESSLVSFAVGTVGMVAIVLLAGKGSLRGIGTASWWELTGGLLGAFFVTMTIIVVPRFGTTVAMAAIIASQLTTSLLLDHLGLFGLRQIPLEPRRAAGVVLLMAGALLVLRR
jgi:transporter family-2 protein